MVSFSSHTSVLIDRAISLPLPHKCTNGANILQLKMLTAQEIHTWGKTEKWWNWLHSKCLKK